jgi:hypothetical protein
VDIGRIAEALRDASLVDSVAGSDELEADSDREQQIEPPTLEQISESLDRLTGANSEVANEELHNPVSLEVDATASAIPSSQELTEATALLIESATTSASEPIGSPSNPENKDPFRDAPLEATPQKDENLSGEDVLAEDLPPALDQQQDDDPLALG